MARAEQSRAEQSRAEQSRAEQSRAEQPHIWHVVLHLLPGTHRVHAAKDLAGANALGYAREAPVDEAHQAQPLGRLGPHDRHLRSRPEVAA